MEWENGIRKDWSFGWIGCVACFPWDLNLFFYSFWQPLVAEWSFQHQSSSFLFLWVPSFGCYPPKTWDKKKKICLVSQLSTRINRIKADAFVELFKLYIPAQKCSEDSAESPRKEHFFTCRAQTQKWKLSVSFGPRLVLAKEIHQQIQKQETNKQLSKTAWHFFCWSASKGENTFLLVDFYGFKDHVFKPTRRQLARKKTGSNKTLNWRKREGLPTARNLTEAVNNTQTRRDYSIFL